MVAQQHCRCLNRQASSLQRHRRRHMLHHCLTAWASFTSRQRRAHHRAAHALTRMRLFKLQRVLLAWYYTTHNLKLHRLHVQLAERQGSLLQLHQQAQQAEQAVQDLQLERARLHQRLERVAEHAKVPAAVVSTDGLWRLWGVVHAQQMPDTACIHSIEDSCFRQANSQSAGATLLVLSLDLHNNKAPRV